MITEKGEAVTVTIESEELVKSLALLEDMKDFCEKQTEIHEGRQETVTALKCAIECMTVFWCENFGNDEKSASVLVWHDIHEDDESTYPDDDRTVLVSFSNFSSVLLGRFDRDEDVGVWRVGDVEETFIEHGLLVDGWWELPRKVEK